MAMGGVGSARRVLFSSAGSRLPRSWGGLWSFAMAFGSGRGCGRVGGCGLHRWWGCGWCRRVERVLRRNGDRFLGGR